MAEIGLLKLSAAKLVVDLSYEPVSDAVYGQQHDHSDENSEQYSDHHSQNYTYSTAAVTVSHIDSKLHSHVTAKRFFLWLSMQSLAILSECPDELHRE